MRPLILTLFVLICALHSNAQADTLYFDQDWKQTDFDGASNYRIFRLDSANSTPAERRFLTEDHSMTRDRLLATGGYILKNGQIKNGLFTFYDTAGHETNNETYDHGRKTGVWKAYRTPSKEIKYEREYHNDTLTESTSYYPNGEIESKEIYTRENTEMKSFDTGGKVYNYVEKMPVPTFNINEYLSKTIVYPVNARDNNIQGRVIVKYIVDIDGTIGCNCC